MISTPDAFGGSEAARLHLLEAFRASLKERVGNPAYDTWFREISVGFAPPKTFLLTARNKFQEAWLKRKFTDPLLAAARDVCPFDPKVLVERRGDAEPSESTTGKPPGAAPRPSGPKPSPHSRTGPAPKDLSFAAEPPHCLRTFENFVPGPGSRVAHAASLAVSERPGFHYNPLYLHGPPGCGKTHLLQAIHHRVAAGGEARVIYVHGESFANDCARAARAGLLGRLHRHYHTPDLLLLDDLQHLAGRRRGRDEFLLAARTLLGASRQIVLAADHAPAEINGFPDEIQSFLRGALAIDMELPDIPTREQIVSRMARAHGHEIETGVAAWLAQNVSGGVRELEGALAQTIGRARLHGGRPAIEEAKAAMRAIQAEEGEDSTVRITVDAILKVVSRHFSVSTRDLLSKSKVRDFVTARQVGMYLARQLTPLSLEQIGLRFGGRDHSTVHYAQTCVRRRLRKNPQLRAEVEGLEYRLSGRRRPSSSC